MGAALLLTAKTRACTGQRFGKIDGQLRRPARLKLDQFRKQTDNTCMSIDNYIMIELQEAAERAAKKVRDPAAMRRACQRLDAAREELRSRVGTLDVSVDLIRSGRDQ
jgi:hypothetical protein